MCKQCHKVSFFQKSVRNLKLRSNSKSEVKSLNGNERYNWFWGDKFGLNLSS